MQAGSPPHYSVIVSDYLNEIFPGKWIGHRGPIEWPPRSPDLSSCDFFLRRVNKNIVYKTKYDNIEDLRTATAAAFENVTDDLCTRACRNVLKRLTFSVGQNGEHIEHLK